MKINVIVCTDHENGDVIDRSMVKKLVVNHSRRAEISIEYVVLTILLLFSFGLIFYFFVAGPAEAYDRTAVEATCRASILAAVHSNTWNANTLECPTSYIAFEGDSAFNVKKRIAEGLASCWHRFGEGKLLLFEHEPSILGTDKISYCNVCEVYEFEDVGSFSDFSVYLGEYRVSARYAAEQPTYSEYLTGTTMSDAQLEQLSTTVAGQKIDTTQSYATLFTYSKDPSYLWKKYLLAQAFSSSTPLGLLYYGTLGLAFGKNVGADWTAQVALVPYDTTTLASLCENLKE